MKLKWLIALGCNNEYISSQGYFESLGDIVGMCFQKALSRTALYMGEQNEEDNFFLMQMGKPVFEIELLLSVCA